MSDLYNVEPGSVFTGSWKLNKYEWAVYARAVGGFAVYRNDEPNPVYLADSLDDAFQRVRVEMSNRLQIFMPR